VFNHLPQDTGRPAGGASSTVAGASVAQQHIPISPTDHTGKQVIEGIQGAFYSDDLETLHKLHLRRRSMSNGEVSVDGSTSASTSTGPVVVVAPSLPAQAPGAPPPPPTAAGGADVAASSANNINNNTKESDTTYTRQMAAVSAARAAAAGGAPPSKFGNRGSSRFIGGIHGLRRDGEASAVGVAAAAVADNDHDGHGPLPPFVSSAVMFETAVTTIQSTTTPEFVGEPQALEPKPLIPPAQRQQIEALVQRLKVCEQTFVQQVPFPSNLHTQIQIQTEAFVARA
jgi:hypothetical protein